MNSIIIEIVGDFDDVKRTVNVGKRTPGQRTLQLQL